MDGFSPWTSEVIRRGEFFNAYAYKMKPGWVLAGWATPPYEGGSKTAVVFEKIGPAATEGSFHDKQEPGFYWVHCSNTCKMIVSY